MMAYFSLSGPSLQFDMENMGRDAVPLAIIIFHYGEGRGEGRINLLAYSEDNWLFFVSDKPNVQRPMLC